MINHLWYKNTQQISYFCVEPANRIMFITCSAQATLVLARFALANVHVNYFVSVVER